ncbi:MAG: TetR/AcrR family transcriptional regulator [Actinomycetota bacterium]|nr:TetR/AcrR family transcriptional regulator [Actinomycetota bacterium]
MSEKSGTQKPNTRLRILEAGLKEFSRKSYRGSTTSGIAKLAKVSEKTIFDLFGDKKSLYLEVAKEQQEQFYRKVIPNLPIGAGAPVVLSDFAALFIDYVSNNKDPFRILLDMVSFSSEQQIRRTARNAFLELERFIERILKEGQKHGLASKEIDTKGFCWTYILVLLALGNLEIVDIEPHIERKSALTLIGTLIKDIEP